MAVPDKPDRSLQLETERLIIRTFRPDDGADLHEYLSLPATYQFEPGEPITIGQARELAEERAYSASFLAVVLKASGKMVGHLYFRLQEPREFKTWELGYIFNPAFHRQGYCTEGSRRLIAYGFVQLQAHRIVASCNPLNLGSCRVLEKCGMLKEGLFRQKAFFRRDDQDKPIWHDAQAWAILESDWQAQNPGSV